MIVKIQTSLDSSDGVQRALIYNKDKSVQYEMEVDDNIKSIMKGRLKPYFRAELVGTRISLGEEMPEQSW